MLRATSCLVALWLVGGAAEGAPPEPTAAHPRILLDAKLRAAWQADAKASRGPVRRAIAACKSARDTANHDNALYQGSEWAKVLQACLVAWVATDDKTFAKTATRFFTALLDDRDRIGDGLGGNTAARRDRGYAIRNLGPYTALAYDWLHAQLPAELAAKARERWAAWLRWYREHGYRARVPGTNYQAGYLVSATLIAVAQAGEGGDEATALWRYVADELWGKDMARALADGGILEGGDWPEGWQYGPLAVTSYALAARVAQAAGIEVVGVDRWLAAMLRRHVYGLTPDGKVYAGGDTEHEHPYLDPHVNTLNAIALGTASSETRRWARSELARLALGDSDSLLHAALATVDETPMAVPRTAWPTWYVTAATRTLFARTRWDPTAVWLAAECAPSLDVDHRHPNAGNFVLSRGRDHVIVDPTPYGSASTLTSNAPTVISAQLPAAYIPSQGGWGERSGWRWITQTASGVVAARCDYADQFRFQHRPSDVPEALRDFVLLPSRDGADAVLVIVDRAITQAAERSMHLRFRIPASLDISRTGASATIGRTQLAITAVATSGGAPVRGAPTGKDCFQPGIDKGKCDAARFGGVTDYRLVVPGPRPHAVHAIAAAAAGHPIKTRSIGDASWSGVQIDGVRGAVVVWPATPGDFTYRAASGTHVILDGPARAAVTASRDGDGCVIRVAAGGSFGRPQIVTLDAGCTVSADPGAQAALAPMPGPKSPVNPSTPARGAGCCDARPPGSAFAMWLVVGWLVRRRYRRAR